ncbi:MAG: SDR family NAD(P)-dependent oxidoreductase [Alphaproteobacteria bacterium]|nr:SDR family NAD(P)-dependent oxidoreductase [Alphaproteobacteria bacterium]
MHAIVTGASSGIGRAIAERLLAQGWRVSGISRTAPPQGIAHLPVDLTDAAATRAAVSGLRADALVHAAGLMRGGRLGALDDATGRALWDVHVQAATVLADALLPGMPDGGRILMVGSRSALGRANGSQYAASKAALLGLAQSWAAELAPRGITVNLVSPAATDTPMLRDPARAAVAPKLPPIGRLIRPEEVAALAVFLLGPEAGAITGQQIMVCGGASLQA